MISTLLTVSLYAVVYGTATFVFKATNDTKNESKRRGLLVCGIIIMAAFACLRDIRVGTDTADTISLYFVGQYGRNIAFSSISDFLHGDILYFIIANIIHLFCLGSKTFLFLMEICIVTPVAISAYIKRDRIPIHITMLIFLLLYYQVGFNWMRQSAASACVLLMLVFAQNKLIKKAVVTAGLAILFHSSAIIGLILLLFVYTFIRIKNKYWRVTFGIGFMVVFFLLLRQWEVIVSFGIASGIFPASYSGYLRVFSGQTTVERWFMVGNRTYVDYLLRVALAIFPIVFARKHLPTEEQRNANFYKMMGVVGLIIYSYILLNMHSAYGNRISYSIEYIQLLNLGMCCSQSSGGKGIVPLRNIVIIGLALFYNVWLYYVLAWHATVPFMFGF